MTQLCSALGSPTLGTPSSAIPSPQPQIPPPQTTAAQALTPVMRPLTPLSYDSLDLPMERSPKPLALSDPRPTNCPPHFNEGSAAGFKADVVMDQAPVLGESSASGEESTEEIVLDPEAFEYSESDDSSPEESQPVRRGGRRLFRAAGLRGPSSVMEDPQRHLSERQDGHTLDVQRETVPSSNAPESRRSGYDRRTGISNSLNHRREYEELLEVSMVRFGRSNASDGIFRSSGCLWSRLLCWLGALKPWSAVGSRPTTISQID